jgi:hypothetical protein
LGRDLEETMGHMVAGEPYVLRETVRKFLNHGIELVAGGGVGELPKNLSVEDGGEVDDLNNRAVLMCMYGSMREENL